MEFEGYIYWQGCNYDNDGHCDDYDLMFCRADNGEELILNGFEQAIFPENYNESGGMSPISVSDKIRGKLKIEFKEDK